MLEVFYKIFQTGLQDLPDRLTRSSTSVYKIFQTGLQDFLDRFVLRGRSDLTEDISAIGNSALLRFNYWLSRDSNATCPDPKSKPPCLYHVVIKKKTSSFFVPVPVTQAMLLNFIDYPVQTIFDNLSLTGSWKAQLKHAEISGV